MTTITILILLAIFIVGWFTGWLLYYFIKERL